MEESNRNTGTVTWITYKNLGTYLQAYALQNIILSLGYNNEIISDTNVISHKSCKFFLKKLLRGAKSLFSINKIRFYFGQRQSFRCYETFRTRFLKINNKWKTTNELNKKYDLFLCGSDQIWSPILPFDPFYYLGFSSKIKVAYAPSVGTNYYPENRKKIVKKYIEDFDFLSVRENRGKELLGTFVEKNISVVLDPTLLLDQVQWRRIGVEDLKQEKNILCYFLTFNRVYMDKIQHFSQTHGLPLHIIITDYRFLKYADVPLYLGPSEFISKINSAMYVFTDSFHGTIFSILFEKKFFTLERFQENASNNQNSRVHDLLDKLDLGMCLIKYGQLDVEKLQFLSINFDNVSEKLTRLRLESINYLKKALQYETNNM